MLVPSPPPMLTSPPVPFARGLLPPARLMSLADFKMNDLSSIESSKGVAGFELLLPDARKEPPPKTGSGCTMRLPTTLLTGGGAAKRGWVGRGSRGGWVASGGRLAKGGGDDVKEAKYA
jgi:hypothetical protein